MEPPSERSEDADWLLDPRVIDADQQLVDRSQLSDDDIAQITRVLAGMRDWREEEERIRLRSRTDMDLNENDMRALRFLVASKHIGAVVTPGALAAHLDISTASTTKLLDRLAAAGHITRGPHPTDRRALAITITPGTHRRVRESVGRTHARRFHVVANMSAAEREVIIDFLAELTTGPA
ncbi:MarR family winged helix-turn-helix transcriptional regulator [Spelaeicoccus albus]|uniref:DNA-binding MarR family transcriptional regulator n=1 Tax=Spelaeicoccus albus TaxID=1280376 RepID=A0A7Z0D5D2_9MICO|nr:MarR family transcriptional regulator [Spelaeicoccus albus]NYI69103.1 DNA-binding MarR family transcriptional regulator [Spelaeicoccus albus]